ncbi:FAD-dependent monooxygenase [Tolypothrix sp. VBCCA 56010]|uniref:FAD-dependent monooxygenase n=1 Tax=Tolypothrix sp. VBCCA 56010 TaxID=3137731 RepID=UPI003D7E7321
MVLPADEVIQTEVCIVGAGPAGITLARELIGQDFRVCLLESGDLEFNQETQSLSEGETVGDPFPNLQDMRHRQFGGPSRGVGTVYSFLKSTTAEFQVPPLRGTCKRDKSGLVVMHYYPIHTSLPLISPNSRSRERIDTHIYRHPLFHKPDIFVGDIDFGYKFIVGNHFQDGFA